MATYKITITLKSPLGTPIQGDTLWGHLCWIIRLKDGEDALNNFLNQYATGDPPVIFSDAFPKGYLPKPLLPPPTFKETTKESYTVNKDLKKRYLVPSSLFFDNQNISLGTIKKVKSEVKIKNISENRIHNTIDRLSGTVLSDTGLFTAEEIVYCDSSMEIYTLTSYSKEEITDLLKLVFEGGYGADVSAGKGNITLEDITAVEFPKQGNRYMALGSFVCLDQNRIQNLRADTLTKRGKVGNIFTHLLNPPFKVPIIMYKAGSTFSSEEDLSYAGELLFPVHRDPRIKQLAMAPVIKYREEEGI